MYLNKIITVNVYVQYSSLNEAAIDNKKIQKDRYCETIRVTSTFINRSLQHS